MALVSWPSPLPKPLARNYGYSPKEAKRRSEMEQGAGRQRQIATSAPARMPVIWQMTDNEWEIFRSFYAQELGQGANWFNVDLFFGGADYVNVEAQFVGVYNARYRHCNAWLISANLEVRDPPLLPRGSYPVTDEAGPMFIITYEGDA